MFELSPTYAGRDRYDWATTSDKKREQIYCYPCELLQQVARSSSPSWKDSSWSGSVSLWAVLQVGSQNVHMILSHVKHITNFTNHYLQIWLLWGHHLRPREGVCEQGEGGAAAVNRTEHRVTSAYHPQSNGLTERFNQTLQTALIKVGNDTQDDWDEHLSSVLFTYRTAQQKATKMLPFEVMFCRQVQVFINYYCWQIWSLFPYYTVTENQCCP